MLHLSESPDTLFDKIASDLAAIRDPRARHWLVLPQTTRGDFVVQAWARKSGIASHSQSLELRTLLEQVAAGRQSRFQFESLRLAVATALPAIRHLGDSPLPKDAALDPVTPTVLEWATALAQALDETLLSRNPDSRWKTGSFLDHLARQPAVARALQPHLGCVTPASFEDSITVWMDSWKARGGIPHLWIQLDAGLPRIQFDLLTALVQRLSQSRPDRLHLYVLTPTPEFWGDARTRAGRRSLNATEALSREDSPGGSLWAFGRSAQALHRQLSDTLLAEGDGGKRVPAPEPPATLLGRLQLSCRAAAPLKDRFTPADDDRSLTIHSCRSALRELENCRDRILQALEADCSLCPEEIVVLLANPEEQAPLVEAAFRPEICPFRLFGFGNAAPSPLATAFEVLFETLRGRVTLEQIQTLAENPLVAARFELEPDSSSGPLDWLRDSQFLWGIDPAHRREFQDLDEPRWSLLWALQRLGLGAILPPEKMGGPLPLGSTTLLPLERATGLSLKGLAGFARLAAQIAENRPVWNSQNPRLLSEWICETQKLAGSFFDLKKAGVDPSAFQNAVVLPLQETVATLDPGLTPAAFLRLLSQRLQLVGHDTVRGPGGIRIADLRHYAGIPARMIVVAGLDSDTFPARDDRSEWHPLALDPRPGDPSRRDADRHAFLLSILACRERLVLSFQGGSDSYAKTRPPSTALADLLQILDAEILEPRTDRPPHAAFLFQHTLNGFSADPSKPDTSPRLQGDQVAASILQGRRGLVPLPSLATLHNPCAGEDLSPKDLKHLLKEPARLFLRSLGIRLPETASTPTTGDLVELDSLEAWNVREELLSARLAGTDEKAVFERLSLSGRIPRGSLGDAFWTQAAERIPGTPGGPPAQRLQPTLRIPLGTTAEGRERFLSGQTCNAWYRHEPGVLHLYTPSAKSLGYRLTFFVDALCIAAAPEPGEPLPTEGVLHFKRDNKKAVNNGEELVKFTLPDAGRALELLRELVPLHDLARRRALPFWPAATETILAASPDEPASLPNPPVADLLEECREKWEQQKFGGGPPDAESPNTRFAFRGCPDPFALTDSDPATDFLPEPGQPLSWRILQYLRAWCQKAGLPLS